MPKETSPVTLEAIHQELKNIIDFSFDNRESSFRAVLTALECRTLRINALGLVNTQPDIANSLFLAATQKEASFFTNEMDPPDLFHKKIEVYIKAKASSDKIIQYNDVLAIQGTIVSEYKSEKS